MEANLSASGSVDTGRDDKILAGTQEEQEAGFKKSASSEGVGIGLDSLTRDAFEQAKQGRFDVVELGEDFEDAARYVPIAGQVVELRRKLFDAAAKLGIKKELELLYNAGATGQKIGLVLSGQAAVMAGQFGVSAAAAPLLAIAAGPIGVASAIGLGLLTLFSSKSEDRKKESARVAAAISGLDRFAERRAIDGLIQDQDEILSNVEKLLADFPFADRFRPVAEASRNGAKDLGIFYRVAKQTMSEGEISALESVANVARWQAAIDAVKVDPNVLMLAIGSSAWKRINQNIAAEKAKPVYANVIAPIMASKVKVEPAASGLFGWARRKPGLALVGGLAAAIGLASLIGVVTAPKKEQAP